MKKTHTKYDGTENQYGKKRDELKKEEHQRKPDLIRSARSPPRYKQN